MRTEDIDPCFSTDYANGRRRFRRAAELAGATIDALPHPSRGPRGEGPLCDVAALGPSDAKRAVVLSSGTHGV